MALEFAPIDLPTNYNRRQYLPKCLCHLNTLKVESNSDQIFQDLSKYFQEMLWNQKYKLNRRRFEKLELTQLICFCRKLSLANLAVKVEK